ncbi:hypothetical protein LJC71_03850 [Desulfosarcina sp. OttesenSCG-928-A07]|nr:hypothetical protein [Desulfosarcina sp. OttesenSCG-928-G17]MDL2328871.1 hypothetical protein [Desulfosarcina sp. OttesenSCG-928-A07]
MHRYLSFWIILLALVFTAGPALATLEEAAEAIGSKTRQVMGGLKKGFSTEGEKRAQLTVDLSDTLKKHGLVLNSARKAGFEDILFAKGVTCYMVSEKPFFGRLIARAYGENGAELGQSMVSVNFATGLGQKVVFEYPRSLDANLVEKYVIDFIESDVTISVNENLMAQTGLRVSQLEEPGPGHPRMLKAYAVATKSFSGSLIATAFSDKGEELDRAQLSFRMNPEESKALRFDFTQKVADAKKFTIDYLSGTGLAVESGESFQAHKLEMTRTQDAGIEASGVRIVCYVIANEAFHGVIIGKAVDKSGAEVGRSVTRVDMKRDDATELILSFPQHMKVQEVDKFVMEARAEPREEAKTSPETP